MLYQGDRQDLIDLAEKFKNSGDDITLVHLLDLVQAKIPNNDSRKILAQIYGLCQPGMGEHPQREQAGTMAWGEYFYVFLYDWHLKICIRHLRTHPQLLLPRLSIFPKFFPAMRWRSTRQAACWPQTRIWWLRLLGDAPHCPTSPPIFLCHLCIFLLIVASPRRSSLAAPIPESDSHGRSIPITVSPFPIFFIILLFRLRFLVYRHASHLSRALSFSFRIPC